VSTTPRARVGLVATLTIACASVRKLFDPDLYWHLATGRWIAAHHAIPRADPFSYTSGGHWDYSDTLASLYFYAASALGGVPGIEVATALLVGVTAFVFLGLLRDEGTETAPSPRLRDAASAVTLAIWGAAVSFRVGPKADWFSFFCFAVTLLAVSRAGTRRTARPLFLLVPLFVFWANAHRGGTLGLAALGVATCAFLASKATRPLALRAALATCAASLVTIANPVGVRYLTAAFDVSTRAVFRAEFPEWAPMQASFLFRVAPAFSLLVVLAVARLVMDRKRPLDPLKVIAVLTTALAVYCVRFAPFAALALAPLAVKTVGAVAARLARSSLGAVRAPLGELAAAALAVSIVLGDYAVSVPPPEAGVGVLTWKLPVRASEFLAAHPPPGRMWNSFNFGGYLLDALGPEQKVFIDGRNDTVYSLAHFEETMRAGREVTAFDDQVRRFDVTFAVVECKELECKPKPWLVERSEWTLVHWDDRALVLVKRDPRTADYVRRFGYRTLHADDAVRRVRHLLDDPEADRLEADVLRYVAEVPDSLRAEYLAAVVHRLRGRGDDYAACRERVRVLADERGVHLRPP
jgi:hypothetical protein